MVSHAYLINQKNNNTSYRWEGPKRQRELANLQSTVCFLMVLRWLSGRPQIPATKKPAIKTGFFCSCIPRQKTT
jgi:hypothetical protein